MKKTVIRRTFVDGRADLYWPEKRTVYKDAKGPFVRVRGRRVPLVKNGYRVDYYRNGNVQTNAHYYWKKNEEDHGRIVVGGMNSFESIGIHKLYAKGGCFHPDNQ